MSAAQEGVTPAGEVDFPEGVVVGIAGFLATYDMSGKHRLASRLKHCLDFVCYPLRFVEFSTQDQEVTQ